MFWRCAAIHLLDSPVNRYSGEPELLLFNDNRILIPFW